MTKVAPAPPPPRVVDRSALLVRSAVDGQVSLQTFVGVFNLAGKQDPKQAAYRVGKRLRDSGYATYDDTARGVNGRPPKLAPKTAMRFNFATPRPPELWFCHPI